MTSNAIPFASDPINTVPWWDEYADTFSRTGDRLEAKQKDRALLRLPREPGRLGIVEADMNVSVPPARAASPRRPI